MKIEKLTENKIRVIINSDELNLSNLDFHSIMVKSIETQAIFSDILEKAEKEVDFHTDGCKLLIEAFSSLEDVLVFTITKYVPIETKKKKLIVKKKSFNPKVSQTICNFADFDTFCEFCNSIQNLHKLDINKLTKSTSLYLLHNTYYLILKNVNTNYENIDLFYSALSEFGKISSFSDEFEHKLLEHGKAIIKKNVINVGIKFFTK